ncbi:hypothetical protein Taro_018833, partial [Colocasia esculenta]|nr:hypothetical protein [Colocasia esculenta]
LLSQGKVLRLFTGRFGGLEVFLACSRCEDLAWSGGNDGRVSFFVKVGEFLLFLPNLRWLIERIGVVEEMSQKSLPSWAQNTCPFTVYERGSEGRRILNATVLHVVFLLPSLSDRRLHARRVSSAGQHADVSFGKVTAYPVAFRSRRRVLLSGGKVLRRFAGRFGGLEVFLACSCREDLAWSGGNAGRVLFFTFFAKAIRLVRARFDEFSLRGRYVERGKRCTSFVLRVLCEDLVDGIGVVVDQGLASRGSCWKLEKSTSRDVDVDLFRREVDGVIRCRQSLGEDLDGVVVAVRFFMDAKQQTLVESYFVVRGRLSRFEELCLSVVGLVLLLHFFSYPFEFRLVGFAPAKATTLGVATKSRHRDTSRSEGDLSCRRVL